MKKNDLTRKELKEHRIFAEFARVCDLKIRLDTIQSRKPEEPDILCETASGDSIAFELVQCVQNDGAQSLRRGTKLKQEFAKFLENHLRRKEFLNHLAGRDILPYYLDHLTESKIIASFPEMFSFLLASDVSRPILNPCHPIPCSDLKGILRCIELGDPDPGEPTLSYFPSTRIRPAEEAILDAWAAKRSKKYETPHPIELLVWFGIEPAVICNQTWTKLITEVSPVLQNTQFRRLWVYDFPHRHIMWVCPSSL